MTTFTEPESDGQIFVCATTAVESLIVAESRQNAKLFIRATTNPETFVPPAPLVLGDITISRFPAVAPNRWHYTTGPATGEYPLIRMTGLSQMTGVDLVEEPDDPTLGGLIVSETLGGGILG